MKKTLLIATSMMLMLAVAATAQTTDPDQNPDYMVSQARYVRMADSINSWHSTTPQETYKAIDYLEDKREMRANRKIWRRELRMERARNSGWYYNGNGYNNGYYPYNNYNYNNGYYSRPWGYRSNWNNYLWNTVPLAATLGWWWSR